MGVPHMHTILKWLIHMRAVAPDPVNSTYPGTVNSHVSFDYIYALIP